MANAVELLEALPLAALHVKFGISVAGNTQIKVPNFWESMSHSTIATQSGVVSFLPFPWQKAFVDSISRREMVTKSRDVGSSEICVRYLCWKQMAEGGNILIKADKHDNAKNLIKIARQYLTSLPSGERPTLLKDNETELELAGIGTIKAMAQGGGRSERCRYLLKTERAWWENAAEEEAAISGALVAGGWLIQESTANGFNDWHGDWVDAQNGYRKTFVGRDENPAHDANWLAEKRKELARHGKKIDQEYPAHAHEAFISSGNCLFEVEAVQSQLSGCKAPLETRLNGALKIWQRPVVGRRYVAGADVASGIDAGNDRLDYSGVAIYDWQTCVHVADLHGQWPEDVFAQMANVLCREYNDAFLGVERNDRGHTVLLVLKQLNYPALYYHQETTTLLRDHGLRPSRVAGWPTTAKTKPILEKTLGSLITSGGIVSYDEAFWDECLSYVRPGDGTSGAQQGAHDDRVIKHMIALQMREHIPSGDGGILGPRWTMVA